MRVILDAKKYWGFLILAVIAILISTLAQLYAPWAVRKIIALATSGHPEIAAKSLDMGLTLLAAYALQAVCSFVRGYSAHYGAYQYLADLRTALYDKLQQLPFTYLHHQQTGKLVSRVMNDAASTERLMAHALPDLLANIFIFAAVAVMLFSIHVKLALASLVIIPFLCFANIAYARIVLPKYRLNQIAIGDLNGALQENLSGLREIQAFNQQEYERKKISLLAKMQSKVCLSAMKLDEITFPLIAFFNSAGTVILIIYGGYLTSINEADIADIVGFIMYLGLFYQPVTRLSDVNQQLQTAIAGCERVFEIIDKEPEVKEKANPLALKNVSGKIEFRNVTFAYQSGRPVLKNFNLTVGPGKTVALVGRTGIGKTTVASLLIRFYDPVKGDILLDGCNLKDLSLFDLRNNVSIVLQDVFLFTGTVLENISYSCKHATIKEVTAAAKKAQAHEFIMALEHGYHTSIGEGGVKLSGGQKQRLAIARALLCDTPVLILDEATSALDTQTEAAFHHVLASLSERHTTLVIAHRLSTLRKADQIVVLDASGIAEQGTHETLIRQNGIYTQLYASQEK